MNWINDLIAVGNYLDAQDSGLLVREGIVSILSLDGSLAGREASALGVRRIAVMKLHDGPGNDPATFVRAVDTLSRLVVQAPPVLVQCHAGRSRSPMVVAGHLMKTLGLTPDEALQQVAARRELAITPGMDGLLWHL